MARVTGIGGLFLRAGDPGGLQAWYVEHLGLPAPDEQGVVIVRWGPGTGGSESGSTVWAAFADDTDYFGPTGQRAMFNYRVDDLDALRASLIERGVEVDDSVQELDGIGRFGWAVDPEGNRFELWEPAPGL
jgi:catechol 2,3-dioxygenase-like lactoylglutathione lyase family enzyme